MPNYYIHIQGQVQGIGFRPFVYQLANELTLYGWVKNKGDGVHIKIKGEDKFIDQFILRLTTDAPGLSKITEVIIKPSSEENFVDFKILKETDEVRNNLVLTPDLAMCHACRMEIKDPQNNRFNYAFTTCTSCGPRYSILKKLPYDREHTSMNSFRMCNDCTNEYEKHTNKRFYSQTNSCPTCAIQLTLYDATKKFTNASQEEIIKKSISILKQGKILAVKGIGGFLLMGDATNYTSIKKLRERKKRPSKPLVVMYPTLEVADQDVWINQKARELLEGSISPIVLLQKKDAVTSGIHPELISPGLNKLGIMVPYTPLFELLLSQFSKPVVATSANLNGDGITFRDIDAGLLLPNMADYILTHNREIILPSDDSIVQFTLKHEQMIVLRQSRGLAPIVYPEGEETDKKEVMVATGSDLKNTFAFKKNNKIYISQYLGDLSSYENRKSFDHTFQHFDRLFDLNPSLILTDKNPEYISVQIGKQFSHKYSANQIEIQHHEAHFASVLQENQLIETEEPVLGIIWDGNGLGHDGTIQGGEFLFYYENEIRSGCQLESFPHLLGNKMAQEPRIAALAITHQIEQSKFLLKNHFTELEWNTYHKILSQNSSLSSTSMGRIFDAAACLIGLSSKISYEGEAAMLLEAAASKEQTIYKMEGYQVSSIWGNSFSMRSIFEQLINDKLSGIKAELIASKFHVALVNIIEQAAIHVGVKKLAFSGGVFQNSLLVDLIKDRLGDQFELYFHKVLPPNDECISFGQIARMKIYNKKKKNCINN